MFAEGLHTSTAVARYLCVSWAFLFFTELRCSQLPQRATDVDRRVRVTVRLSALSSSQSSSPVTSVCPDVSRSAAAEPVAIATSLPARRRVEFDLTSVECGLSYFARTTNCLSACDQDSVFLLLGGIGLAAQTIPSIPIHIST